MGEINYHIERWVQALFTLHDRVQLYHYPLWAGYTFKQEGLEIRFGATRSGPSFVIFVASSIDGFNWELRVSTVNAENQTFGSINYFDYEKGLISIEKFNGNQSLCNHLEYVQKNLEPYLLGHLL